MNVQQTMMHINEPIYMQIILISAVSLFRYLTLIYILHRLNILC